MMTFMQTNLSNQLNTNPRNDLFDRTLVWHSDFVLSNSALGDLALIERGCDGYAWNLNDANRVGIIACPLPGSEKRSLPVPSVIEKSLATKFNGTGRDEVEAPAYLSGIPTIYNLNWSTFRWESPPLCC